MTDPQAPPTPMAVPTPVDPSQNVLKLVEAAIQRQDDLRNVGAANAEQRLVELDHRVTQRFDLNDKALQAALASAKEAVGKSEIASLAKFDSVNEFREQLADQALTFMRADLANAQFEDIRKQLLALTARVDTSSGVAQGANVERRLDGIAKKLDDAVVALSASAGKDKGSNIEERLTAISKQIDTNTGKLMTDAGNKKGGQAVNAAWLAAAGLLLTVIALLATRH